MEKGINTIIVETKMKLMGELQNSQLPITVLSMIIGEIQTQLKMQEEFVLNKETEEFNKNMESDKNGDN